MTIERVDILSRRTVRHPDGRSFTLYGDVADITVAAIESQSPDTGHDPTLLHRRFDRLTASWVLVSPSRNVRPSTTTTGAAAPACPLCPGGPELPGAYELAVFDNRFPSLSPLAPDVAPGLDGVTGPSRGRCLVVVYTSEHIADLADLTPQQFANVIAVWRDRTAELWREGWEYVMAFENHGSDVGATLPHLHGQIYALDHLPPVTQQKLTSHIRHRDVHDECLGCRLIADDLGSDRVILDSDHFLVATPYAARWPLETHVRAKQHGVGRLADLDDDAALDLARALDEVVTRYDALWGFELPYLMCVQEAPAGPEGRTDDWHLHVELLPPHRNAQRLKVRASVETALGVFINDTVPEAVAAELRAVPVTPRDWSGVTVPIVRATV